MEEIPITRLVLGEAETQAAARVIASGWIGQGPEVLALEAELREAVHAAHAVVVSSGTAALELALRALRVGPGDEVVTVSHSFIATANAVWAVGARPVFVDVEDDTLGMDPRALEAALGPRTRAVLCAHQLGLPCDLEAILTIAQRHGVPVIEDAACAIGSEVALGGVWQRIGRPHGLLACFSFHPRKVITTGEGGAVTTADAQLAERVRRLRQHGLEGGRFVEPAFNYRMTDLQAAIGRPQLRRLTEIVAERRALADRLSSALAGHRVLSPPQERATTRTNWQSYPVRVRGDAQAVALHFSERGIATRPGIVNAHEEPAYRNRGAPDLRLPVSEARARDTLLLPLFHGMTAAEERRLIDAFAAL